jgi:magnesium transporter
MVYNKDMIQYYYKSIRDKKIHKIEKPKKGTWIFSYDINEEEMDELVQLGFHQDILEDALDYFEVPRFENEDSIHYFFTRYLVHRKDGEISTAPLLIAISSEHLLTISHEKPEFLDDFAHGRRDFVTTQKNKSFFIFLDTLISQYERSLIRIRRTMLRYYGNIEDISEDDIKHIVALESKLADYLGALVPTAEALNTMLRKGKLMKLHEEDIEIVEDLQQDVQQVIASAKSVSKTVQNIRSAHSDILAHKLNITMKTLTAVTIIFTIPTIVSGIFGMNTWLPFTKGPYGFFIILFLIALISWLIFRHFEKKNWI